MENHNTFAQRIARIESGRGLTSSLPKPPQIKHSRSREREDMLRGRARGAVYLFAGFCAGLLAMGALADLPSTLLMTSL